MSAPSTTSVHNHRRPSSCGMIANKLNGHAVKLNEQGAFWIETGDFDRACETLVEAFNFWKQIPDEAKRHSCRCSACSLESCVSFSQQFLPSSMSQSLSVKRELVRSASGKQSFQIEPHDDSSMEEEEGFFVYRKPIRMTPVAVYGNHSMSAALPLIINFNLALANHLKTIENHPHNGPNDLKSRREALQLSLELYKLSYQGHLQEQQITNENNLQFTMILANNLSEIHRLVENQSKHQLCLQHLLSAVMFAVDNEIQSMELEGFFRNTSQLILRGSSAAAA